MIQKVENEFKNTKLDTKDTTETYERKIQAKVRDLHKQGKIDDKTKRQIYPSGCHTPSASVAIKAHKPEKDHPGRIIISHTDAAQAALASFLDTITAKYANNSPYALKNTNEFIAKVKNITLNPDTKLVSYDATALFPSIPITDCLLELRKTMEN